MSILIICMSVLSVVNVLDPDSVIRKQSSGGTRETASATWRDLAYAARQFRRTPVFTVGIVLTLGFGIGASATVYSWMAGVVLRPLPAVRDVETLITVRPERRNGWGISM